MHPSLEPSQHEIYLDHAAITPLDPAVWQEMKPHLFGSLGNPGSLYQRGRVAAEVLATARARIATALGVTPNELIFTGGGTESANLAVCGLARAHRIHGKRVIVSAIEHKAVLAAAKALEREGWEVTYLPVDREGRVAVKTLQEALRPDTTVVSIMYANNEIGTIEPIAALVEAVRTHRSDGVTPLFHTDACQAVGQLPVAPRSLGVDVLTLNSAKCYGPKGVGLLYLRNGVSITPIMHGGDQEQGRRAGTENLLGIVGFASALDRAVQGQLQRAERLWELQRHFRAELVATVPDLIFNGPDTERLPNNVHVCIPDVEGESLVLLLDYYNVAAATGSACSSLDLEPSHVLAAIGRDETVIHGSLRFTFSHETTEADLTYAAAALGEAVVWLRSVTASTINSVKAQLL